MNYSLVLAAAGEKAARTRAAAAHADSERDFVIRQANYHGGMSARDISGWVGISHQRVAQIINTNPISPPRAKLHEAIVAVLREVGADWVPVAEVARLINERALYTRKDRAPLGFGADPSASSEVPGSLRRQHGRHQSDQMPQ